MSQHDAPPVWLQSFEVEVRACGALLIVRALLPVLHVHGRPHLLRVSRCAQSRQGGLASPAACAGAGQDARPDGRLAAPCQPRLAAGLQQQRHPGCAGGLCCLRLCAGPRQGTHGSCDAEVAPTRRHSSRQLLFILQGTPCLLVRWMVQAADRHTGRAPCTSCLLNAMAAGRCVPVPSLRRGWTLPRRRMPWRVSCGPPSAGGQREASSAPQCRAPPAWAGFRGRSSPGRAPGAWAVCTRVTLWRLPTRWGCRSMRTRCATRQGPARHEHALARAILARLRSSRCRHGTASKVGQWAL